MCVRVWGGGVSVRERERARYSRMVYRPEVDQSDRTARQKMWDDDTGREDNAQTVRHDGRCEVEGSQVMKSESLDWQEAAAVTDMCTDEQTTRVNEELIFFLLKILPIHNI